MTSDRIVLCAGSVFSQPGADAVGIDGDRIRAVGPRDEVLAAFEGTATFVDVPGAAILPGFVDAHVHLFHTGLIDSGWRIDLADFSRDATLDALAAAVSTRGSGEWVVASGWDESTWADARYLDRRELDRIAPDSPVIAVRMDGHMLIANSAALRWAEAHGVGDLEPQLVDAERGALRERAAWALQQTIRPDRAALGEAMVAAVMHCHRLGITSVHTMSAAERVDILTAEAARRRLRTAVYAPVDADVDWTTYGPTTSTDPWFRWMGAKIFTDGSIGAMNAAVAEPYTDDGGTGALNWPDETVREWIERAERMGHPTAIHAIGDRAIEQVIRLHEEIGTSPELRHRIEHFELAATGHIERARDAGLGVCMQPNCLGRWSGPGRMNERRLGVRRDRASNPLRHVLDAGLALALGSDGMPLSPLYGIHWAVNAAYPGQRLTVDEAVAGYALGGAWLTFDESDKGRIAPGALADLVVLDDDPGRAPKSIIDRTVVATYVGGERVFPTGDAP